MLLKIFFQSSQTMWKDETRSKLKKYIEYICDVNLFNLKANLIYKWNEVWKSLKNLHFLMNLLKIEDDEFLKRRFGWHGWILFLYNFISRFFSHTFSITQIYIKCTKNNDWNLRGQNPMIFKISRNFPI